MEIAGWENMYRSGERGAEDHPTALLVETLESRTPGKAIDLACGTGRNALYLAAHGWDVTAIDGSAEAIDTLERRAEAAQLHVKTKIADLQSGSYTLLPDSFDLVLIAYYLQRDLFAQVKTAVRANGIAIAIAHIPEPGEPLSEKRAAPGELRHIFEGWKILWDYEGPSRDPAHRRPVAEIVAQRIQ